MLRTTVAVVLFTLSWLVGAAQDLAPRSPETHALLINGGQKAADNALSHLHHLEDMVAELSRRGIPHERIHVFSSDGESPEPDLVVRGSLDPRLWLVEGTALGGSLRRPQLTDTQWAEVTQHPATVAELRKFFERMRRDLAAGDTLLVFVTDHGNRDSDDPGNGTISLWNQTLSVLEFRALLGHLQPGVRVINVMSQCFSGAFAAAMAPFHDPTPSGDVCGFFSTTAERPAYGCYPEGRDRDRIGHAFSFIDAMSRNGALDAAHVATLVSDTTPDVPVRTSDLYLERRLREQAERDDKPLEALVDELLREAWKDRARWEPEIRLLDRLGSVYGVFSPRSLAEFEPHIANLEALSKELATYGSRWGLSLNDLRTENLQRFSEAEPKWKERLTGKVDLDELSFEARRKISDELLPVLEQFTRSNEGVWARLERLREKHGDAESAEYRIEIRLAALLRMRTILTRVAGRQWLESSAAEPLAALVACESTVIGAPPAPAAPLETQYEPLPPFEEDLAVVERVLPSWLGIQFGNIPEAKREQLDLERGAVVVQQVYEGSAAHEAGIEVGDLVVGPPGAAFDEPRRIREWIMDSPRDTPLPLVVLRESTPREVTVSLDPYPRELPRLPEPPRAGDAAPEMPALALVANPDGTDALPLAGRHALFFWATWCAPCKAALPELLAWSSAEGVPIVAVSDEDPETVRTFLASWTEAFPQFVATDELRLSYVRYGVSGTPTFVLVGDDHKIGWRQTGYSRNKGLSFDGWRWAER